jgi:hypothetical protein
MSVTDAIATQDRDQLAEARVTYRRLLLVSEPTAADVKAFRAALAVLRIPLERAERDQAIVSCYRSSRGAAKAGPTRDELGAMEAKLQAHNQETAQLLQQRKAEWGRMYNEEWAPLLNGFNAAEGQRIAALNMRNKHPEFGDLFDAIDSGAEGGGGAG